MKHRYYSLTEAVKMLGCKYGTAWNAVALGKISPMYVGAHPCLTKGDIDDLRKWLDRKKATE